MPKEKRDRTLSYPSGCGRYPYPPPPPPPPRPRFSSSADEIEMKEWDEIKCPICMESPHNTVLLKCSSYHKGCRPYMCNTSYRHSNCLNQFCKSFDSNFSSAKLQQIPLVASSTDHGKAQSVLLQPKLTCPLCRGGIYGYMVSETARSYMNSKIRSCSSETCEFQGTYSELRKHARLEHPTVRPTEVDPSRQGDWVRMEQQRELQDVVSSINERYSAENSGEHTVRSRGIDDLASLVVHQFFTVEEGARLMSSLWSDPTPRHRMPLHYRRSETVLRVSNDTQTNQSARWRSSLPSTHHHGRIHRAGSRINLSMSSSHDSEAYNIHMELEVRTSSTRMPPVSQYYQPNPSTNNSSSRWIPGIHLRWRHQ